MEQYLRLGVTPIAKTTLPEFGLTASTESSRFGATRNPWDTGRSAGGSSGGSAALLAAGVVPIAHANDGGGSIRIPAACCGLVGLKPSRGRLVDRPELAKLPVPLTTQGVLTRSVRDTARYYAEAERLHAAPGLPAIGHVEGPGRERLRVGTGARRSAGPARRGGAPRRPYATPGRCSRASATTSRRPRCPSTTASGRTSCATGRSCRSPCRTPAATSSARASTGRARRRSPAELSAMFGRSAVCPPGLAAPAAADGPRARGRVRPVRPGRLAGHRAPGRRRSATSDRRSTGAPTWCGCCASPRSRPCRTSPGRPAISLPLGRTDDGRPIGVQVAAPYGLERRLLEVAYELEAAAPWPTDPAAG